MHLSSGKVVVGLASLAGLAALNAWGARRAERANPPRGRFVDAHGVRLHYVEAGPVDADGPPIVLLHGNVVTLEDWIASGVLGRLARQRRVVAFDRPGFGHSDRPRGHVFGPSAQAEVFAEACDVLGLRRPVVVGHSWGALVAHAWGLDRPDAVSGVVLVSGYYFPTARLDAAFVLPAALPVVGDVLRHTVSPPFTRAALPGTLKVMFAPQSVPRRFEALYSHAMMARPVQIRAAAGEGAVMVPSTAALRRRDPLRCPAAVIAGTADKVVDHEDQTVRFARAAPGARLGLVRGAGHMVHHAAPRAVAEAALAMG